MRPFRAAFIVLALVLAACGDDDDAAQPTDGAPEDVTDDGSTDGGSVRIEAQDVAFDLTEATVPTGETRFTFVNNDDGIPHNLHITGDGVDASTDIEEGPDTQEVTVDFEEPGEYRYVCDVHPSMTGTITVT